MIGQLLERAVGVQERITSRRFGPALGVEVQLLEHRDERREARPRSHHQHVLEALGPLGEREIADDALEIGEPLVGVRLDPAEERFGEAPEHAFAIALEDHVELEVVARRRLERSRGDGVRMGDGAPLLDAGLVDIGDVADLVSFLHLAGEQAVFAAQRDVLARLVGGKERALGSDQPEK